MPTVIADAPRIAGNLLSVPLPSLLQQPDRPLLLLLHGTGANERDLAPFLKLLPRHFAFALLRGPFVHETGFAWLGSGKQVAIGDLTWRERLADPAARAVEQWLSTSGLDTPSRPISVLGFSGGGAVALQLLRRDPGRYAGCVLLSGFLSDDDVVGAPAPSRRPRVFWGYDPDDAVIPAPIRERTSHWLSEHSALTNRPVQGLGHRIDEAQIAEASSFLVAG